MSQSWLSLWNRKVFKSLAKFMRLPRHHHLHNSTFFKELFQSLISNIIYHRTLDLPNEAMTFCKYVSYKWECLKNGVQSYTTKRPLTWLTASAESDWVWVLSLKTKEILTIWPITNFKLDSFLFLDPLARFPNIAWLVKYFSKIKLIFQRSGTSSGIRVGVGKWVFPWICYQE